MLSDSYALSNHLKWPGTNGKCVHFVLGTRNVAKRPSVGTDFPIGQMLRMSSSRRRMTSTNAHTQDQAPKC
jgi:hypothetical protein